MSVDDEKIIKQNVLIKSRDKDKPGMTLRSGTLLLTNKRLIYIQSKLGLTHYKSVEDFEKDLEKKGSIEIPISKIVNAESDHHWGVPYFNVTYETDEGSTPRSFWLENVGEIEMMTDWVEAIFKEMKKTSGDEDSKDESEGGRHMFIVDQSHDQDDRGTMKLAEIVNDICEQRQLDEPFAIQGNPGDELLMKNKHLLPTAVILMSIGMQSGDKFSQEERVLIEEYVRNGGHLLLAAFPPAKPPNEILEYFGISFRDKSIEDEEHHAGRHKDHIIVDDLVDHPINEGVKSLRIGKFGCYPIEIENPEATVLAYSSKEADPPQAPIATIIPHGSGMALVVGQTRLFQDDFIEELDNARWFKNIVNYLTIKQPETITVTTEKKAETKVPEVFYCPNCGKGLSIGDQFCGNCGQRVNKPV